MGVQRRILNIVCVINCVYVGICVVMSRDIDLPFIKLQHIISIIYQLHCMTGLLVWIGCLADK